MNEERGGGIKNFKFHEDINLKLFNKYLNQ